MAGLRCGNESWRRIDMAKIKGEITIRYPVEAVFDYVADQTN